MIKALLAEGPRDILYMASAAHGKTLPPLIAALENRRRANRRLMLWVVPTIALAHDYQNRLVAKGNYGWLRGISKLRWRTLTGLDVEGKKGLRRSSELYDADVLVISPESLLDPTFLAWLTTGGEVLVNYLVIDEAHLIDEWGVTFRRAYLMLTWLIKTLRQNNDDLKVLALSASLPPDKESLMKTVLAFDADRTQLMRCHSLTIGPRLAVYRTRGQAERRAKLIRIVKSRLRAPGAKGVIFSAYRREHVGGRRLEWSVPVLHQLLAPHLDLRTDQIAAFTGATKPEERQRILRDLHSARGRIRLVLATSAFGFGIDVHSLTFSIHMQTPEDMDRFYQEISRCSREPYAGYADLFYTSADTSVQTKRNKGTLRPETIETYISRLGLAKASPGTTRFLDLSQALNTSGTFDFSSRNKAQMSADGLIGHAFEAILALIRFGYAEILPLERQSYYLPMSQLRTRHDTGRTAPRFVKHGGSTVHVPALRLPIRLLRRINWTDLASAIAQDKVDRGARVRPMRKLGLTKGCQWSVIAAHYNMELIGLRKLKTQKCGHCANCKKGLS